MPFIAFRDFGPIAHAEVDLKPLTILIGSNNTGKSYLALAIYALSQAMSGLHRQGFGQPRSRRSLRPIRVNSSSVRRWKNLLNDPKGLGQEVEKVLSGQAELRELPPRAVELIRTETRPWAKDLSRNVEYELRRCFGSTLKQLGRRGRQAERDDFEVDIRDESTGLIWDVRCSKDDLVTVNWDPGIAQASIKLPETGPNVPNWIVNDSEFMIYLLTSTYSQFLLHNYSIPSHYLPASRSGILQGHKTLANLIIGRASSAWIESMEVERLPGVITDLVQALLVLERGQLATGRIRRVVEFLETNVVSGSVDIVKQLEYPEIRYHNRAGDFDLHQVSSTVSEIAPMVLYLKYLVRAGHLFILEEPESHLDPANQRLLARAIAMLVNAGIRILVTTHSDIVLNQINNLMQISSLDSRRRLRMGYKATEVVHPSHVSAYVFQPDAEGTQVCEIPVDADEGISTEAFDAVHRALYDESIKMEHVR